VHDIKVAKIYKKFDGNWKSIPREEFKGEDDLDGLLIQTTSRRMFLITEKTKKT
jgi:hypothetical protein